ncbi:MAG: DNA-processing protein DprA [Syntrophomonadaceae bacterium]|nr:DNA-processing protein DprA [Syntrophomonadaceae bacterium]
MDISNDSYAILLLCSDLAVKKTGEKIKPFTVAQWSKLAERLVEKELTPQDLFEVSSDTIQNKLNLTNEEVTRIERLFSLSGQLSFELSSLNDKGIFTLTRADKEYPAALKNKLKKYAPPVLYYAGKLSLLNNKGIAVVGSRNIDEVATNFTEQLSKRCTYDGLNIISGGARGVDSIAESVSNSSDGTTVIIVADNMERKIRNKDTREAVMRKQSLILSPFRPDMPFQAYAAMERNKYVYALSDFVVIISSDFNKGGTWAGATENLKRGWVPMFVRKADDMPQGNINLLKKENVYPITEDIFSNKEVDIYEWFKSQSKKTNGIIKSEQIALFDK